MKSLAQVYERLVRAGAWAPAMPDAQQRLADEARAQGFTVLEDGWGPGLEDHEATLLYRSLLMRVDEQREQEREAWAAVPPSPPMSPEMSAAELVAQYGTTAGLRLAEAQALGKVGVTTDAELRQRRMDQAAMMVPGVPYREPAPQMPAPAPHVSHIPHEWLTDGTRYDADSLRIIAQREQS